MENSNTTYRTKDDWIKHVQELALLVMKLTDEIPFTYSNTEIIKQITRSSNSTAANYRATKRTKSTADFMNKLKIVEEECDETMYWLEIIQQRI
ncbi:MAG: four helix bundle protein, partial [Bacteroidota bacterium]